MKRSLTSVYSLPKSYSNQVDARLKPELQEGSLLGWAVLGPKPPVLPAGGTGRKLGQRPNCWGSTAWLWNTGVQTTHPAERQGPSCPF